MKYGLILTGCAGFIGINILFKLNNDILKRYERVISIDKLGYATVYNRELYKELCNGLNIETLNINLLETSNHIKFSKEFTWDIIDLASNSHVDKSIENPYSLYEENSLITSRFLSAFEDIKSIRVFYHISTDEVYGSLPLNAKKSIWFKTNSLLKPSNPYAASKAAQDLFLLSMKHTFNLPVCIYRMANQIGNFQHPEKMIPASCLRAYRNESIKIYGNGKNMRQWTPVDITADIIVNKLNNLETFDVLHIANKNGLYDNNYIIDCLKDTINQNTGLDPKIEYINDRKGHDLCYALTTTKEIDKYFSDVNIDYVLSSVAEFYYLKKDELK
jgi:dTDP-glucose 4,6-dehydratase